MERPDLTGITVDQAMYIAYLEGQLDGAFRVIENKPKATRATKKGEEEPAETPAEPTETPDAKVKKISGNAFEARSKAFKEKAHGQE